MFFSYSSLASVMASTGLQLLGMILSLIGWVGSIITCALPMWKVTAFIGNNIVVAQTMWEGLWMNCIVQSTGQMQCKIYDSMLALPQDLQAARALTVVCILVALLAILIGIMGAKCTNCVEDENTKARVSVVAGVVFLVAGTLMLIPVCWSANTTIRDFYNPLVVDAQKRELGASLYIGWGASALMLLGGGLLCCSCPKKSDDSYTVRYTAAPSQARSDYANKNYV
ncbi:claudin-4-like [Eleutherodactylus coqui]|uniref:claudin-4-like n=1 Tax=Eleutherodactylus coqui TaxID=57060 RepID=UPI003463199C